MNPDLLNKIHQGDCLEFMRGLPDKCIDLVVTDPPYGIGAHDGIGKYGRLKEQNTEDDWDNFIPDEVVFNEIFRISKNQVIFGGNYFGFPKSRCWAVWDKGAGFYDRDFAEVELVWTSFDRNSCIYKYDPLAGRDYKNKFHPTQKPKSVMEFLLNKFSQESDIIFDPFAGSGTTLVASKQLGRKFLGCELSEKYVAIANERLRQDYLF